MIRQFSTSARTLAAKTPRPITPFPTKYSSPASAYKNPYVIPPGVHHHPAPAAPSAFQTPYVFLPDSDPRKALLADSAEVDTSNMPSFRKGAAQYHITEADIKEMRRLHEENPEKWTRAALMDKFGVSGYFAGSIVQASAERVETMNDKLQNMKNNWSVRRENARMERQKRKAYWYNDA
ncbi:hypothetical protein CJU90_0634 [Yarrowia sp. C11]|nr:hypothetical protein CKK34_2046 [Yarrowia sp. E02]KAG5372972.1 hypothetical protein CJU90_0634 [Yarrowia sp. C11]